MPHNLALKIQIECNCALASDAPFFSWLRCMEHPVYFARRCAWREGLGTCTVDYFPKIEIIGEVGRR